MTENVMSPSGAIVGMLSAQASASSPFISNIVFWSVADHCFLILTKSSGGPTDPRCNGDSKRNMACLDEEARVGAHPCPLSLMLSINGSKDAIRIRDGTIRLCCYVWYLSSYMVICFDRT